MKNLGNLTLWIEYKRNKAKFRRAITKAKKESWENFVKNLTKDTPSSIIWNKMKMLRNQKSFKSIIIKDGNSFITAPDLVANKLAEDFSTRGNCPSTSTVTSIDETTFSNSNSLTHNKDFTIDELDMALHMGSSSTPGPDNLPPEIYRQLSNPQKLELLDILNFYWNNDIPSQWRKAIIIPIPKPKKIATQTTSYRPIALTNSICKIMERIVTLRLKIFLETNHILSPFQSGFRSGFSTLDSL